MALAYTRRLNKELAEIHAGTPVGINLVNADTLEKWLFTIEVMGTSEYEGEKFLLMFRFDNTYPISAPAVQFVVDETHKAPVHPHIYSNGHICASILGREGWSPVLTVVAICITIQSMLASCKKKEPPSDNDRYVPRAPENPKKARFHYHVSRRAFDISDEATISRLRFRERPRTISAEDRLRLPPFC